MFFEMIIAISLAIIIYSIYRYHFLIPAPKGLQILLYHKISDTNKNKLTVNVSDLERHFDYLKKNGYNSLTFSELSLLIKKKSKIPEKSIIITFDDGYENNLIFAAPLLKKFGLKAAVFLPLFCIGKTNEWDAGDNKILNFDQIKEMSATGIFEFGIHSFNHENIKTMTPAEFENDLKNCISAFKNNFDDFIPVYAYPYGSLPEDEKTKNEFKRIMSENGIEFGLMIKSRRNPLPFRDRYELKRINIRGDESHFDFKIKLKKGRVKLI